MTADATWLREAIAVRDLEPVTSNMAAAGDRVNDARRHVRSVRVLADDDAPLAMAACHDAIRKSSRPTCSPTVCARGEGAHRIVLDYARTQLVDVNQRDRRQTGPLAGAAQNLVRSIGRRALASSRALEDHEHGIAARLVRAFRRRG